MKNGSGQKRTSGGRLPRVMEEWQDESGFRDLVGYRLALWEPGRAEVTLRLDARHMNRSGVMHGGVLTSLIDTACGYAGTHAPPGARRYALTLTLTAQFLAPGRLGMELIARARAEERRSLFFADCQVTSADGGLIGRGEGVFKYRGSSSAR